MLQVLQEFAAVAPLLNPIWLAAGRLVERLCPDELIAKGGETVFRECRRDVVDALKQVPRRRLDPHLARLVRALSSPGGRDFFARRLWPLVWTPREAFTSAELRMCLQYVDGLQAEVPGLAVVLHTRQIKDHDARLKAIFKALEAGVLLGLKRGEQRLDALKVLCLQVTEGLHASVIEALHYCECLRRSRKLPARSLNYGKAIDELRSMNAPVPAGLLCENASHWRNAVAHLRVTPDDQCQMLELVDHDWRQSISVEELSTRLIELLRWLSSLFMMTGRVAAEWMVPFATEARVLEWVARGLEAPPGEHPDHKKIEAYLMEVLAPLMRRVEECQRSLLLPENRKLSA